MAIAARKPQASSPNSSLYILDELDCEYSTFAFDRQRFFSFSDTIDAEVESFSVAETSFFSIDTELDISTVLFHFHLNNFELYDELSIDVFQNFTEQLIPIEEVDSSDAVGRLDNLELDLALFSTNPSFFKEFAYTDGDLTGFSIYTSAVKDVKLMDVTFTYTDGDLTQKQIHRISDSAILTIGFNYSNGDLVSQSRVRI